MGLFESMKASPKLEQDGVWLDLEHSKILVARAGGGNAKYNAAGEKIAREHKRVVELGLMSSKKGMALYHRLFADTVVLAWETLKGEGKEAEYVPGIGRPGGEIVPFTPDNVVETFVLLPDLFMMVKSTAEDLQFFRQALLDDAVKN